MPITFFTSRFCSDSRSGFHPHQCPLLFDWIHAPMESCRSSIMSSIDCTYQISYDLENGPDLPAYSLQPPPDSGVPSTADPAAFDAQWFQVRFLQATTSYSHVNSSNSIPNGLETKDRALDTTIITKTKKQANQGQHKSPRSCTKTNLVCTKQG